MSLQVLTKNLQGVNMNINNETIAVLKKLDWQQDLLEGFYSVIISKGVLDINAGNPPEFRIFSCSTWNLFFFCRCGMGRPAP